MEAGAVGGVRKVGLAPAAVITDKAGGGANCCAVARARGGGGFERRSKYAAEAISVDHVESLSSVLSRILQRLE